MSKPSTISFERNLGIMSESEWVSLSNSKVLIVGLGGLGGHIADSLVRLGVRSIILVDYDRFDPTNLNRQLYSSTETIGKFKVDVIFEAMGKLNPEVELSKYCLRVQDLDPVVFECVDIIIDAVDDIETKLFLEKTASRYQKPLLHGAVGGWYGQIGLLMPGSFLLKGLYEDASVGAERWLGSPTFTPAVVANMMVSEWVKYVLHRPEVLIDQIMMIDLLHHQYRVVIKHNASSSK